MRAIRKPILSCLVLLPLALAAGPAHADGKGGERHGRDKEDRVYEMRRKGEILPLADIKAMALRNHPGKVLEVEFEEEDSGPVYELYILQSGGRVMEVEYDARTGRLLKAAEDD